VTIIKPNYPTISHDVTDIHNAMATEKIKLKLLSYSSLNDNFLFQYSEDKLQHLQ
jgi:hypothetical protein